MARVLANSILTGQQKNVDPMSLELARAIDACNKGDKTALNKVLTKAITQLKNK
jgi:hypothetical protein